MSLIRLTASLVCLLLIELMPVADSEARSLKPKHAARGQSSRRVRRPPEPQKLRLSIRIAEAKRDEKKSRMYRSLSRRKRTGLIGRP